MMKKIGKIIIIIVGIFLIVSIGSVVGTYVSFYQRHIGGGSETDSATKQTEDREAVKEDAYNGTGVPDNVPQEVLDTYLECLKPADDEYDYRFQTDYEYHDMIKLTECHDSKGYEKALGYADVSLADIKNVLDKNENISSKYKDFIYEYARRLRELYPEVNLSVLYHNLHTLKVNELTQDEINVETISTSSAAFYKRTENMIGVAENLDLSKDSDDYIILVHELSHAARGIDQRFETGGSLRVSFWDNYKMGYYAEEGIITNLAYEIQGFGEKAVFYPMQASYFRIISECIGYTGADYFNHGVNYLIDEMDRFMGDEQYAYKIIAMIDAQASLRYTPTNAVDFYDFQPVYEYLAKMYFKKHITKDMTREEQEAVFDAFYEEITFNFENMNRKYTIDENTFRPTFETYLATMSNDEVGDSASYENKAEYVTESSKEVTSDNESYANEKYNGSGVPDQLSQKVIDKYKKEFLPADDEYDYKYVDDFTYSDVIGFYQCRDAKGYLKFFGYTDVTLKDIRSALDKNSNISDKYKDFIYDYASKIKATYPKANLSVLYANLDTLIVDEICAEELAKETLSTIGDTKACYIAEENRICVLEDIDFKKNPDDEIIFMHELTHAARKYQREEQRGDVKEKRTTNFCTYNLGTFAEEAIITNMMYELQGLNKKSEHFYTMACNYYRIILECIDYSGADYFNHNVLYLVDKMDKFMGEEGEAWQIVARIDSQMNLRYNSYMSVDFYDFQPVYEYLAKMYFKKHIAKDMTKEEQEAVFDAFYEEITFGTEGITRKYTIDEDTFRSTFEKYISK